MSVLLGVEGDERVVAPEAPPARVDDPRERFGGSAAVWLGGVDDVRDFGDRSVGDGFEQRFAGGEVHVDGGAHDARAASDLGHAGFGVARQRVDGGVEDAGDAALGVRAPTRRVGSGWVVGASSGG